METTVPEIIIDIPDEKTKTCRICCENDLETEQMFFVALCGHEFCVECVKRYVEVGLLEGSALRCPYYQCESMLSLISCADLLTPKLRELWERRMEVEAIPVTERIYCPNPKCSVLMSKTKLEEDGVIIISSRRSCVKCGELFCINCKVPWHNNLSCDDYKRLGPNPTANDIMFKALANTKKWRQCGKCKHMIQRSIGCNYIACRCGYKFCYKCGAEWRLGHQHPLETGPHFWEFLTVALVLLILIAVLCDNFGWVKFDQFYKSIK